MLRTPALRVSRGTRASIAVVPVAHASAVFVHHTAIHNDGGFKSLAEGEKVRACVEAERT